MTSGTQLYPADRLTNMSDFGLNRVLQFAVLDMTDTRIRTVYAGMTRHETVLTAQRTITDVAAEMGRRAVAEITRVHDIERAYDEAAKDYADAYRIVPPSCSGQWMRP